MIVVERDMRILWGIRDVWDLEIGEVLDLEGCLGVLEVGVFGFECEDFL